MTNNTDRDTLAKQYASARNYSYEANMNDYSQASIDRAKSQLDEIKANITSAGLEPDTLIEWSDRHGCWKPKP